MNDYEQAVHDAYYAMRKELESQGIGLSTKVPIGVVSSHVSNRLRDAGKLRESEDPVADTEKVLNSLREKGYV